MRPVSTLAYRLMYDQLLRLRLIWHPGAGFKVHGIIVTDAGRAVASIRALALVKFQFSTTLPAIVKITFGPHIYFWVSCD